MENIQIPENIISEVAELLSSRFGMRLDSFIIMKNVSNSIVARMNLLDMESPREYLKSKIRSPLLGEEELKELFDIISVNETFFFRIPEHFKALGNYLIPRILNEKSCAGDNSLSIWSAGCSTGEEPYTMAIVCNEMERLRGLTSLSILGSDQDGDAVSKASAAVFSDRSIQKIPPRLIDKYLLKQGNSFHLKDEIKSMVKFEKHNLNNKLPGDPFDRKWDIIFCRNVLIYFKKESIEVLMNRFHECLNSTGFLTLGPWETQHCPRNLFDIVMEEGIFIFKKKEESSKGRRSSKASSIHRDIAVEAPMNEKKTTEGSCPDTDEAGEPHENISAARHYTMGNRFLETGDTEAAYAELMKTIELDPGLAPAYILLAVILRSRRQLKEAEYYLNKALYNNALCIPALFYLGNIHLESGKIEKGILELEMVRKLLGGNKPIEYRETLGNINPETILQTCKCLIENQRQP